MPNRKRAGADSMNERTRSTASDRSRLGAGAGRGLGVLWNKLTPFERQEIVKIMRAGLNTGVGGSFRDPSMGQMGDASFLLGSDDGRVLTAVPRTASKLAGADLSYGDRMRVQGMTPRF